MLDFVISLLAFLLGFFTVYATLLSAVRTFVMPRSQNVLLTRVVFQNVLRLFRLWLRKVQTYERQDEIMAYYAPVALLLMPIVWVIYVWLGFGFMYWAVGVRPWGAAFTISGSSLLTLGTVPFISFPITILEFAEATIGLGLVALLISYLPTMYSAFSRREAMVTMLEVRAGSPPSAVDMIDRVYQIRGLEALSEIWRDWEVWFSEIDESHSSLTPLIFFRSPQPDRSWVTAAGTVLDCAALTVSTVDIPPNPQAQLCIRAGYLALRHISDFFYFAYDPDPHFPATPISITRQEFDDAYDELQRAGVPLKPDRDQCWQDFAGWRVNYDATLLFLAQITYAPYAPWSSDRGQPITREQFTRRFWL